MPQRQQWPPSLCKHPQCSGRRLGEFSTAEAGTAWLNRVEARQEFCYSPTGDPMMQSTRHGMRVVRAIANTAVLLQALLVG